MKKIEEKPIQTEEKIVEEPIDLPPPPPPKPPGPPPPRKYNFYPQMMSLGNKIVFLQELVSKIDELKKKCDETPNCIAFTTDGWLLDDIAPQEEWVKGYKDPTQGLYIRL